jgi:hypothetical protein
MRVAGARAGARHRFSSVEPGQRFLDLPPGAQVRVEPDRIQVGGDGRDPGALVAGCPPEAVGYQCELISATALLRG